MAPSRRMRVLLLGEPGSGKTTLLRDVARILAVENNVVVVDTSPEIAGDGSIAHDCIGLARRFQVPSLERQAAKMIEVVQNHTPHVMVIDEIGRSLEVVAAKTTKQRGVRCVASAHGDLRKLVKNAQLNGLVGGVESIKAQIRTQFVKIRDVCKTYSTLRVAWLSYLVGPESAKCDIKCPNDQPHAVRCGCTTEDVAPTETPHVDVAKNSGF